jgi:hypothetical protein
MWIRMDLLEIVQPGEQLRDGTDPTDKETQSLEILLEDARWAISGMIYGFDVTWTPSARNRGVDEILLVEPVASIPRGDPEFRTVATHVENGFLFVTFEYRPDAVQQRRLDGWAGQAFPAASGAGTAPVMGWESRREAMNAAIRNTLREWAEGPRIQSAQGNSGTRSLPRYSENRYERRFHPCGCLIAYGFEEYQSLYRRLILGGLEDEAAVNIRTKSILDDKTSSADCDLPYVLVVKSITTIKQRRNRIFHINRFRMFKKNDVVLVNWY